MVAMPRETYVPIAQRSNTALVWLIRRELEAAAAARVEWHTARDEGRPYAWHERYVWPAHMERVAAARAVLLTRYRYARELRALATSGNSGN
jgi:hypothetical protein